MREPRLSPTPSNEALIHTGTYTGDGTTSMAVTGIGFQPKYVKIWPEIGAPGNNVDMIETTDTIIDDNVNGMGIVHRGGGAAGVKHRTAANRIISLDADGFTVDDAGTNSIPNESGQVYNYIAIG